jgi:hypothetical protein
MSSQKLIRLRLYQRELKRIEKNFSGENKLSKSAVQRRVRTLMIRAELNRRQSIEIVKADVAILKSELQASIIKTKL